MGEDESSHSEEEIQEEKIMRPTMPSESDESDSNGAVEEGLREQVADVSFEELQKARSDGRIGLYTRSKQKIDTKRANKNRPMELSSKKPVPRFREIIQEPKRVIRDPRFESLCGDFEESKFKSSYSFLYNEQLPAERQRLQQIQKRKGTKDVQAELDWIDKQLKEEEERRKQATKMTENKSKQKRALKQGNKPYYLKKSEIRKGELVDKFKELKSSGQLERYMTKRRKKNAAKDHRFVPYRRNVD